MNIKELEPMFVKIEKAIDDHPTLLRVTGPAAEPFFNIDRVGCQVTIRVGLKGSRKKPSEIHGQGDTPEEAVDHLINGLDFWAKAIA